MLNVLAYSRMYAVVCNDVMLKTIWKRLARTYDGYDVMRARANCGEIGFGLIEDKGKEDFVFLTSFCNFVELFENGTNMCDLFVVLFFCRDDEKQYRGLK